MYLLFIILSAIFAAVAGIIENSFDQSIFSKFKGKFWHPAPKENHLDLRGIFTADWMFSFLHVTIFIIAAITAQHKFWSLQKLGDGWQLLIALILWFFTYSIFLETILKRKSK